MLHITDHLGQWAPHTLSRQASHTNNNPRSRKITSKQSRADCLTRRKERAGMAAVEEKPSTQEPRREKSHCWQLLLLALQLLLIVVALLRRPLKAAAVVGGFESRTDPSVQCKVDGVGIFYCRLGDSCGPAWLHASTGAIHAVLVAVPWSARSLRMMRS